MIGMNKLGRKEACCMIAVERNARPGNEMKMMGRRVEDRNKLAVPYAVATNVAAGTLVDHRKQVESKDEDYLLAKGTKFQSQL